MDHKFLQKWATLTDPKDTKSGIKGFVKCTITVMAKGDLQTCVPTAVSNQDEDVEKNLLLPKQVSAERPWAKFYIKIYKAEDLPNMNSGFMGTFSKILGENKIFIDPYVQVTFAGQQGETSVEGNTTTPEWNEQITFVEMFPPLARRIKVQVIDDAKINDFAVATHFINLQQISDAGINGVSKGTAIVLDIQNNFSPNTYRAGRVGKEVKLLQPAVCPLPNFQD
ncbi:hypothetical protein scyTo_0010581 [Scyliorhinus torazame]|uniref:C2 domain-containing protein n=1 Tax=Scyliorhinus torazame TaxID=75743 RepID=A0A401P8X3_SCYTO|nr:hypothetical protein [Scyliorhinus torazame]